MDDAELGELRRLRRELKSAREAAKVAHPFGRELGPDPDLGLYDDGADADAVLVAFPGEADKLGGIPAVDFFDATRGLPIRRIYLRRLSAGLDRPHELGTTFDEVRSSLERLVSRHTRKVFFGTSSGGYHALVHGTLLRADHVIAFNPTTSLRHDVRAELGDQRSAAWLAGLPQDYVETYGDILTLWESCPAPPVEMIYQYRNDVLRGQAERIADCANVRPLPHYEFNLMAKLRNDGSLRAMLERALVPG